MSQPKPPEKPNTAFSCRCGCASSHSRPTEAKLPVTRRGFLQTIGLGAMTTTLAGRTSAVAPGMASAAMPLAIESTALPTGVPLRVLPVLTYQFWKPAEKTSWRSYGALQTEAEVQEEAARIRKELETLASRAEFPLEILPLVPVPD